MKVIEEVVGASQNDFEENGVQQQTLSELQQVGSLLLLITNLCIRQHFEDVLFEFLLHSFRFPFLEYYGVHTCYAIIVLIATRRLPGSQTLRWAAEAGLKDLEGCWLFPDLPPTFIHAFALVHFRNLSGAFPLSNISSYHMITARLILNRTLLASTDNHTVMAAQAVPDEHRSDAMGPQTRPPATATCSSAHATAESEWRTDATEPPTKQRSTHDQWPAHEQWSTSHQE